MKQKGRNVIYWLREHSNLLKVIFIASVFLFVVNQMANILQGMTWEDLLAFMGQQRRSTLVVMLLLALISVLPMLIYDFVTVEVLEKKGAKRIAKKQLFVSAWTTNTVNNLAGFGGIIGATLRTNFYGKDHDKKKVIATVSKIALFMLTGLSCLCLIGLLDVLFVHPASFYRSYWVWLVGGSLYAPSLFLFILSKKKTLFADFSLRNIAALYIGSIGQWGGALLTFLLIGKLIAIPVSMGTIYPLFIAATLIGMISMVPGGMGTFDVMMILGLAQSGVSKEMAVAWLLYYRLFYYILPFFTGLGLFIHQTGAKINRFFDNLPKIVTQKTAHFLLVCMIYFAGIMMVLLSTVPHLSTVNHVFTFLMPFSIHFLDQTLNMIVGYILLGLARGIANRVKKAYLPTLFVLGFCIVNTISRTVSWKLLLFYLFLMFCIFLSRKEFYRRQLVYSWRALLFDGVIFGSLFLLYSIVGYYATDTFGHLSATPDFFLFPSDDVWFSGLAGLVIALLTLSLLYHYLSLGKHPGVSFDAQRIQQFTRLYGGNQTSQLTFLQDKKNYFYQENGQDKVMFTYEVIADKLFVLGDPLGEEARWLAGTQEFLKAADTLGYQLAFYQISDHYTLLLHDLGFDFMKVGEEGFVAIDPNAEQSTQLLEIQTFAEKGYTFQLIFPDIPEEIMVKLEQISDAWVKQKGEKYFSTGRFRRAYINKNAVGIVKNRQNELVAFVSLNLENKVTATYDLLRYRLDEPEKMEDFIIAHLIEAIQKFSYQQLDIGLAPLANVGDTRFSYLRERIMNVLYQYGNPIYRFQEQRLYKENFATKWVPRYLAYQSGQKVSLVLLQLWLLIRGHRKKVSTIDKWLE